MIQLRDYLREPVSEKSLRQPCICGLNPQGIYKPKVCYEHSSHGAVCFFCWVCGVHKNSVARSYLEWEGDYETLEEAGQASLPDYLDRVAKPHQNDDFTPSEPSPVGLERSTVLDIQCPYGLISEPTSCGRQFAKDVVCGREWCDYCGGKDGISHQRRKARWLPKARLMRSMGYFTLTMPVEARPRAVETLSRLGRQVTRIFQRNGFDRGLRRWHWFGDEPNEAGGRDWHPHVNVLVDGGWLPPELIERVRKAWARALGVKDAVIYYEYADTVPSMLHIVKYVLRPTFERWQWDVEMAAALHGFRNSSTWGLNKWVGEPVWDIPEGTEGTEGNAASIERLEAGFCPHCGDELRWTSRVLSVAELLRSGFEDLGAGYYERRGPPLRGPTEERL